MVVWNCILQLPDSVMSLYCRKWQLLHTEGDGWKTAPTQDSSWLGDSVEQLLCRLEQVPPRALAFLSLVAAQVLYFSAKAAER